MVQQLIVALIVLACSGYAAWTLMPAWLRQRVGARLGLKSAATGCGGCSGCAPAKTAAMQPVHIVRRPPSA